jgi:hypothetical protein
MARILITEGGFYCLSAEDIVDAMGQNLNEVQDWIKNAQLKLTNRGDIVTYQQGPDNLSLCFVAERIDSLYTDTNVYWLQEETRDPDHLMEVTEVSADQSMPLQETFSTAVHAEEDVFALTGIVYDPYDDFWFWSASALGYSPDLPVYLDDVAAESTEPAAITVNLRGGFGYDSALSPDYNVEVYLNGNHVGTGQWDGTGAASITAEFPHNYLSEGNNTLTVKPLSTNAFAYDLVYVDSADVRYQRGYRAVGGQLRFTADAGSRVTVTGFSDPNISLYEVSDPTRPMIVTGAEIVDSGAGEFEVRFQSEFAGSYLAVGAGAVRTDADLVTDVASDLKKNNNQADYLLITTPELEAAAQDLADYREDTRLKTMVVLLQDIYDEFSFGIADPQAIKDFLAFAYQNWKRRPAYVLLAGDGTWDYKDIYKAGGNVVPVFLVGTPHGLFPSDNRYADVVGDDGVPEMAIGRLPVMTSAELEAATAKIIAYESATPTPGDWSNRVILSADNNDPLAGNFPKDSDDIGELIPAGYDKVKIYYPLKTRSDLITALGEGALFFNYIGHATYDKLADEGLLKSSDVAGLQNAGRLPVLTALTCVVGDFSAPGTDTLSEEIVLVPTVGAVAAWAPSGESYNHMAKVLGEGFYEAYFVDGEWVLGLAVQKALVNYAANAESTPGYLPFMLDIFNLIGDPALQIK